MRAYSDSAINDFKILGIESPTDDPAVIKQAFKKKILENHPDKNPDDKDAAEARARDTIAAYNRIKKGFDKKDRSKSESPVDASEFKAEKKPATRPAHNNGPTDALIPNDVWVKVFVPIFKSYKKHEDEFFRDYGVPFSIFCDHKERKARGQVFITSHDIDEFNRNKKDPALLFNRIAEVITEKLVENTLFQVGIDHEEVAQIIDQHSFYRNYEPTLMAAEVMVRLADIGVRVSENKGDDQFFTLKQGTKITGAYVLSLDSDVPSIENQFGRERPIKIDISVATIKKYLFNSNIWAKKRAVSNADYFPKGVENMQEKVTLFEQGNANSDTLLAQLKAEAHDAVVRNEKNQKGFLAKFDFFKSAPTEQDEFRVKFYEAVKSADSLREIALWLTENCESKVQLLPASILPNSNNSDEGEKSIKGLGN